MTSESESLSKRVERVQEAVRQLPAAATTLNTATDQLSASVGELDAVLKRFGLGVPTWVAFNTSNNESFPHYYTEEIGYAKISGKWGVAVKTVEGHEGADCETVEQWLFNDAPRLLRIQAIEKIPDLLEALLKKAAETAEMITAKVAEVDALTAGIKTVLPSPPPLPTRPVTRTGKIVRP